MDAIPIAATRSRRWTTAFAVVVFLIAVVAAPTLVVLALVGAPGSVVITASVSVMLTLALAVAGYFISAGIRDARENPARTARRELAPA